MGTSYIFLEGCLSLRPCAVDIRPALRRLSPRMPIPSPASRLVARQNEGHALACPGTTPGMRLDSGLPLESPRQCRAYRSPNLSQEPTNRAVAREPPSLAAHRRWIFQEVLPEAKAGKRFILVHRNRWSAAPTESAGPCVLFSDPARAEPNRPTPDSAKLEEARPRLERMKAERS
jgi:hypothetical protein